MAEQDDVAPKYEASDVATFMVKSPLYEAITARLGPRPIVGNSKLPAAMPPASLFAHPVETLDAYCPECKEETVYQPPRWEKENYDRFPMQFLGGGIDHFEVQYHCSRNPTHTLTVFLRMDAEGPGFAAKYDKTRETPLQDRKVTITKIGMFPPLADMQKPFPPKFRAALGEKSEREFKRAIGLASHGIGVGSFVYQRRIFET